MFSEMTDFEELTLNLKSSNLDVTSYKKNHQDSNKRRIIGVIGRKKVGKSFILSQLYENIEFNEKKEENTIYAKYTKDLVFIEGPSYNGIIDFENIKLIQEYIISVSDILIVVINHLNFEDLIIFNLIRKICNKQITIVIHNFLSEVEIEDYLKNLLTNLNEKEYINFNDSITEAMNKNYYTELFKRKRDGEEITLVHLIYDNGKSKKNYNITSKKYIKNQIQSCTNDMKIFSLKDSFEQFKKTKNLINKNEELNENIQPPYSLYIDKDNNACMIKIGFYEKPQKINLKVHNTNEDTILIISGISVPINQITENETIEYSNLQDKEAKFELQIKVPTQKAIINTSKDSRTIKYLDEEKVLSLNFPIINYNND
jgi:hypothetical protein